MNEIRNICIAGSGIMGIGIAQVFAQSGYEVTIYDLNEEQLNKSIESVRFNQRILIENDILSVEEAEEALERIQITTNLEDFKEADIVVEAIIEKLDIKQDFFKKLEEICREDVIFATNTSSLSVNHVCAKMKDKSRFIGTNWWNPAHIIPLVEVTRCKYTSDDTAKRVFDLLKDSKKEPVVLNDEIEGFIGNRIQFAVFREALNIAEQGIASFEDIDRAIKFGIGFRYASLGPFETADLGGLDTFYYISQGLFKDLSSAKEAPHILEEIYSKGNYGIKTGEGFFKYDGDEIIKETLKNRDNNFIKTLKALSSKTKIIEYAEA